MTRSGPCCVPTRSNTEEWLEAHRTAHEVGLRSNITIMFGSVERPVHWARHLVRTRDLQKETGGFTEFVPLPFVHMAAPVYLKRGARRGPTWRESVLMHAVARIAYRGLVDNIQASWVKLGQDGARQLLAAGVNDLGGTLMDENISRAAGATHGQLATPAELRELASSAGRVARQRTTLVRHGRGCTHSHDEARGGLTGLQIGYKASAEQFGPRELVEFGVLAEQVGLDSVMMSDHLQPWRHIGGHGPSALACLTAHR